MDLHEAIYARRSVRAYKDEPVDRGVVRALIDAAIQAPSAMNEQPWAFSVVEDRALLTRISAEAKAHMLENISAPTAGASALRGPLANPDFHIFYHAPVLIVISSASHGRWASENCALAAQNLMLAARAAGLGSCWIGLAQAWLATPQGRAALAIPESHVPVAPIIVGHPSSEPAPPPRKAASIHWLNA